MIYATNSLSVSLRLCAFAFNLFLKGVHMENIAKDVNHRTLGATLLVAGCCIGAGMLGLPVMTGAAGFLPSLFFTIVGWLYMLATGIVLTEVVLSFDEPSVHLLTMVKKTLGRKFQLFASVIFAFLFYAIMMAYIIATSFLISDVILWLTGYKPPFFFCSTLFTIILFVVIARGLKLVDCLNRYLMLGLIACYLLLVFTGISDVQPANIMRADWRYGIFAMPILVISFGFHNLVPTLSSYLEKNANRLKRSLILGSLIPLIMYILWEYVILGIAPYTTAQEWRQAQSQGAIVPQILSGNAQEALAAKISDWFTFFAIATSFLPVAFSFMDFLHDGFHIRGHCPPRWKLALCVLIPPYLGAVFDSHLFLQALNVAGGFCAVTIFGILPALMALKRKQIPYEALYFRFSSHTLLFLILLVSCIIIAIQTIQVLS
jgi:tyrosine-specific transport protein